MRWRTCACVSALRCVDGGQSVSGLLGLGLEMLATSGFARVIVSGDSSNQFEEKADENADEDKEDEHITVAAVESTSKTLADGHTSVERRSELAPQMTQAWWDVHYSSVLYDWTLTGDPRQPGALAAQGGLTDASHLRPSLACIESLLRSTLDALPPGRAPRVLVVGCGLSPLTFALADVAPLDAEISCVELSPVLVDKLQVVGWSLPRPPRFLVGDVTKLADRAAAAVAGGQRPQKAGDDAEGGYARGGDGLEAESFDLIVDENVIDGMACVFPPSASNAAQRETLDGIRWLLRPTGHLLTISFVPLFNPPYAANFVGWARLEGPQPACASSRPEASANFSADKHHLAIWKWRGEAHD